MCLIYKTRQLLRKADGPYDELTYSYNNGRLRSKLETDDGTTTQTDTYTYPTTNSRLQSIVFGGDGSRVLTYDGSGNVITDTSGGVTKTYAYNTAGRMQSLTVGSDVTTYVYNALGQQVIRTLPSGQVIHVVHDYEGNRLAEYDYDASINTFALLREYVWLDGEVVGVVENDVFYFVRTDHIGRPVFATDDAGTGQWTASYKPFGEVQASTGNPMDLRFPGQRYQSESGLHQNWMREYDPTTGRYLQADPLGLVDGPSVYGYALQNPGRYVDPRGEQTALFDTSGGISMPTGTSAVSTGSLSQIGGAIRIGGGAIGLAFAGIVSATPAGTGSEAQRSASEIAREGGYCGDPCEEAKNRLRQAKSDTKQLGSALKCASRSGAPIGLSHSQIARRIDILQREVGARADAIRHCKPTGHDHAGQLREKQRALNKCWSVL